MKKIFYVIFAVLAIFVWQSCGRNSDNSRLVYIDSLILVSPDSACDLLSAYSQDSLTTDNDWAYHALLTTIADYKAYRPATTDSVINIAVNYYDNNGNNRDKRMRSLLYKGCVMEELGNDKEAMRYYKHAQYACSDKDNFHQGYIHFRIATLYQNYTESDQSITGYKCAMKYFLRNNSLQYYRECVKNLGEIYHETNNDSAYKYINWGIKLSQNAVDARGVAIGLVNLSGHYYNLDNYAKAKEIAVTILNDKEKSLLLDDLFVYYFACMSYIKMNNPDSAQVILDMMPPLQSAVDSMQYFRCKAEILKKSNNLNADYHSCLDIADALEDSLIQKPLDNGLVAVEKDVEKEHIALTTRTWWMWAIACILVIVVIAVYFYRSQKKYRHISDQLKDEVTRLNGEIALSLAQIDTIKEHGIEDQKKMDEIIESIDASLACYSSIISKYIDRASINNGKKNEKVIKFMNKEFFVTLRRFVNLRHENLIEKLQGPEFKFTEEELNIICLDLCKFPPHVVWTYSKYERLHSIFNKKSKIAAKAECKSISEFPDKFK
ncbi:MAG: hypothetical protein MJZ74_00135 [Muribaculaceae bacterium]|nr:hypothetical protein [Muribaculaceae bacterium]